jgi:endonuclease/exonuclease/phosphatase family metal-dependent hydrolase
MMITATVSALDALSLEERSTFIGGGTSIAAHDAIMNRVGAMNTVETGGSPSRRRPLAFPFNVSAWNLERCLFVEDSAAHLAKSEPAVVLLTEMDNGMARTGQRHTTADLAAAMNMTYVYGVEFLEMGLGSDTERDFCVDRFNDKGFHGNGVVSSVPLDICFMVRLRGERLWRNDADQPRIGERCAVGGVIATEAGSFVAVSVHLESATTAAYRERQMTALIDEVEAAFPGLPSLIGGDLNTGNHTGGDFEAEGLFAMSAARGFTRHGGPIDQMTTRPSLITRWPERTMKLDWFLSRGLEIGQSTITTSLDHSGRPLSDHDFITCRIDGFA